MAKTLSTGSGWIWLNNASPGVSETSISVGNLWINTVTNNLFLCKDATSGSQVWDEYPKVPVLVSKGGTGAVTLTGILVGNGTSAVTATTTPSVTSIAIGTPTISSGAGAPGTTQPKGSLYLRTDGSGTNDRAYINTDSAATWTAIVTVA